MRSGVEAAALAIEAAGVALILAAVIWASARFLSGRSEAGKTRYEAYRRDLGRGILLGLELLVAADIIGTVAVAPTLQSVLSLAVIVLIRTFLSFSLELEIEGWPPWAKR